MHPAMQRRRHRLMIRRTTQRRSPRRGLATFLIVAVGVFVLFVGGTVAGTGAGLFAAYDYFSTGLPDPHIIDGIDMPASTYVYDRTGTVLLARFECENREEVRFAELPDAIVNATVAAEDRTFWTNDGIDYTAVARAALANLRAGSIVQGASTITQQVIKYAGSIKLSQLGNEPPTSAAPSVELDPGTAAAATDPCEQPDLTFLEGRGFGDKIREQILARQVTAAYPGRAGKERIMETYLNLIYYGNRSYGIKAASANFFGTSDLSQLTLAQGAFLAGLPQLPSYYDPYQPVENPRGPSRAITRRNDVLDAMLHEGYVTQRQHDEASAVTWEEMNPSKVTSVLREPHFAFRVQHEVERILGAMGVANPEQAVRTGGYRITTSLDYPLQQVAKEQVTKWVQAVSDKNVHNGALVAVDSATGQIVAYVGSVDYYNRDDPRVRGQFDVAGLGRRQPGSAFKPITYSSAFRARQATPATFFLDAVTQYGSSNPDNAYIPTNANIKEHGPVLAMDALRYSLNVPSVMMQYLVGVDVTAQFAQTMGVASSQYILGEDPGLTLTLGSVPVNLTNMTQAYGVFADQGTLHPATTVIEIRDRDGTVIYDATANGPSATEPMTTAESYLTHWILEGNTNPRTNTLWGERAQLLDVDGKRRHAGFKTGTTNDFRDVSGFGYVPGSLVTGVWMGNNNQEPLSNKLGVGLYSADGPLYLWHDFMKLALNQPWDWNGHAAVANNDFPQPPGVVTASVCRFSGMKATGACGPTITVPFLDGTVPPPDNVHVNKSGGAGPQPTPDASGNVGKLVSGSCFDVVKEVAQDSRRPPEMVRAAQRWADRFVNGQLGPKGDPNEIGTLGPDKVWLLISPLRGNTGFGAPICGEVRATPTPVPTPQGSGGGGGGGGGGGCPPGKPGDCTPAPTLVPTPAPAGGLPVDPPALMTFFVVPAILGGVPLAARVGRWGRLRRRRR
ncbi:MAG: transglycosylase domain-containing protein [Chloroflexota bacterium]